MRLRGYRPPPLPGPSRKPSKWIKDVVFPPVPEPDRSLLADPHTYDSKGTNTRVAAWLFLGLALAAGLALGLAFWRKPAALPDCARSCRRAGGSTPVRPPPDDAKPTRSGTPAAPTQ